MYHVRSINANQRLHPGRAQNLINFNWLMNKLPSMGIDPMMLVYDTAHLINQPVQVVGGNDFVLDTETQLLIPKDDNLRRCSRVHADGEDSFYFLTYALNVPDGNPGAGLPLSYTIICQDAITWAGLLPDYPMSLYDAIFYKDMFFRNRKIDYVVYLYFFFLKEIIRTPQVFGSELSDTPVGDAVSWSECASIPSPLNPCKRISFIGRLATFIVHMAYCTLRKAVWLSILWLWSCTRRIGQ